MDDQSKLKILAVEDDEIQQELLTELMPWLGYEVEVIGSGEEAIEKLTHVEYDSVLTDLALPGISGDEVAAAAKNRHTALPVVMVSGSDQFVTVDPTRPNVDEVVEKPYAGG